MSTSRSSHSLRLGAVLFSVVASLGACATVDSQKHGFASASVAGSSATRWGFASTEPSQPEMRGFASLSEPPRTESWGFVQLSTESSTLQAARP